MKFGFIVDVESPSFEGLGLEGHGLSIGLQGHGLGLAMLFVTASLHCLCWHVKQEAPADTMFELACRGNVIIVGLSVSMHV